MIPGYHGCLLGAKPARWLLLHGFTGASGDWVEVWPPDWPALAIDLPGHGESPDPRGDFSAEIARLLAALPPEIDRLAGYSLGGRVALALMAAAPERFRALIIVSAHPGLTSASERDERRQRDERWIRRLSQQGIKRFAAAWQRQPLLRDQHRRQPAAVARQMRTRLAQRPLGLARNLACLGLGRMPPTWSAIDGFGGDLFWVTGALDAKFTAIASQVRARRPATRHQILPDCGHNPLIEAPAALAAALRAFGCTLREHAVDGDPGAGDDRP